MRTDLRLLSAALDLFAEHGFQATSMRMIAERAGVSPGLAYKYHPSKDALAMALYARIAERFVRAAPDLPSGTVGERFRAAMQAKLALLTPHRSALRALAARALDPNDRLGVLGPRAAAVRSRNSGVFSLVVEGASDSPAGGEDRARLARLLYGVHLALVLVWTQDTDPANPRVHGALELVGQGLGMLPMLPLVGGGEVLARADAVFGDALGTTQGAGHGAVVEAILTQLFERRRLLAPAAPTSAGRALHRPRIASAVAAGEPLQLVLPAFPAKSANREKTLGPLPDLAERVALRSLQALCDELSHLHPPGVSLVIASDGHVFADLVEVSDADVSAYQRALRALLQEEGLSALSVFDLAEALGPMSAEAARVELMARYGPELSHLRERAEAHPRHRAQFDGIHRFLFEDAVVLHAERSRSQLRRDTKERAWAVIQRSEAWGALVAEAFPAAVRLSIHPQPEVSDKIGVHLIDTQDAWLTPWHGVAMVDDEGAHLVKRADAEARGATLVGDHYQLGAGP